MDSHFLLKDKFDGRFFSTAEYAYSDFWQSLLPQNMEKQFFENQ